MLLKEIADILPRLGTALMSSDGPSTKISGKPHRIGLILAGVLGIITVLGGCERVGPSVIFISIDCLNQRQFETALEEGYAPTFRELRGESIVFTRAYAHAPWTTPSHMSMMTGLYPSQHGRDVPYGLMIQWNDYFSRVPSFKTMAQRLREEGYETAAFTGQGSISGVYGLDQGFGEFREHRKARGTLTDLIATVDDAIAWISDRKQRPFFLFLHTYDLHGPRPKGLPSDREAIEYIDRLLSRLFIQLKSYELYDSSLVILTGDHGSNMVEVDNKCCVHGAGHYEENLKVPLLLKLPDGPESREEHFIARHVDLLPTVMDVLALRMADYDGPGISLLRRAADGELDGRAVSFSEADGRCAMRRGLVTERYKYIYTPRNELQALLQRSERFFDDTCKPECRDLPTEELYDLRKDPFEHQNLLEGRLDEERAAWLEWLRLEMARHLNLPRHYAESVMPAPRDSLEESELEELRDSLRTLGYIR